MNKPLDHKDSFVSFRCKSCGQEIEAHMEMAGTTSECPACGNPIHVPLEAEAGTLWAAVDSTAAEHDAKKTEAMKGRTIRIELSGEF